MCQPASFVLTKDRVFWSKRSDSHEDIIREHGLHADGIGGPNIVRVEIVPPDGDMTVDLLRWEFSFDQDILPEWVDREECEARTRISLTEWVSNRVVLSGRKEVADTSVFACGASQVTACENSQVKAYGNSQVTAYGASQVTACENSQVTACGNSQVTAYGNSQVKACENSQVKACGNSQVKACGNSQVTAYGNSQVTACENYSTVRHYSTTDPIKPNGPHAVVIDSRGNKSVATVGT
jgi:hypothetical protein